MASAMAGEHEREGLGENGDVLRVHGAAWSSSIQPRGEEVEQAAASCVARAAVAVGHLPACLAGKQLAGAALGWAGRWAGCWRQVSFSIFFYFLFL